MMFFRPRHRSPRPRVGAASLLCLLVACGAEPASPVESPECAATNLAPVLFVHGSGLSAASWAPMIQAFQENGYPAEFLLAVDMTPRDGDNAAAASTYIAPAVRQLLRQRGDYAATSGCADRAPGKVDIVAHSMGAVSARWYVARVDSTQVRTLISIAGANHGTNALCASQGAGDRQLCPAFATDPQANRVQVALNGSGAKPLDETPFGVGEDSAERPRIAPTAESRLHYFTVRRDPDRWIVPADSALLDGAGGRPVDTTASGSVLESSPGNFLYTGSAAHDDLPREPGLIRFALQLLAH